MKQLLFVYAILWHPTEAQIKEGQKSKIIVEPTTILANSEAAGQLQVAMSIPVEYKDQLDQIDIAMRPF